MPVEVDFTTAKPVTEFRNYKDSDRQDVVENHYRMMRMHQCVAQTRKMLEKYSFDKPRAVFSMREAFKRLESYVDSSDPDVSIPNAVHMVQTAEGIRKAGHPDWMQLVGLMHDLGKIMFLWGGAEDGQVGKAEGPQWSLGGDTWVVGCKIPDCVVFPQFNPLNPDYNDERYNTDLGMYSAGCGMENLLYAYGHDEYVYHMLKANKCTIPEEGYAMLRYHSCYPWHTGGAYRQFMTPKDHELEKWVLEFNKFDLYTKDQHGSTPSLDEVWPYYQAIIDKYFPNPQELMW